jgi:tyrosyl-tRNA synthetase
MRQPIGRRWTSPGKTLEHLLVDHGLATSVSDAGRKIQQGAVRLDGARFSELRWSPIHNMDTVVTVGRKAFRLKVIA